MNSYRKLFGGAIAALVVTVSAFAAEQSPNGTWKWSVQGRPGGQSFEQTLTLKLEDKKLTGMLLGVKGGQFQVPDTPITEATYSPDGTLNFAVTRELNGKTFTTRYEGKLSGDVIKGTYERPGVEGAAPTKRDWDARRQK
jgi:hypothetical protein